MTATENPAAEAVNTYPTPFYEDTYAKLEFDPTVPCIKLTLHGVPRYSEHYQLVQLKRLELLARQTKEFGRLSLLTDSSTAGPVLDEDVQFFKKTILPEIENAGVKFLAIVMPEGKFTQLTIREMTQVTRSVTVQYFDSMREARLWLKSNSHI